MTDGIRRQARVLLILGALLSPSTVLLFMGWNDPYDPSGLSGLLSALIWGIPAIACLFCLGLGIGRLSAANEMKARQALQITMSNNGFIALQADEVLQRKKRMDRIAGWGLVVVLLASAIAVSFFIWVIGPIVGFVLCVWAVSFTRDLIKDMHDTNE